MLLPTQVLDYLHDMLYDLSHYRLPFLRHHQHPPPIILIVFLTTTPLLFMLLVLLRLFSKRRQTHPRNPAGRGRTQTGAGVETALKRYLESKGITLEQPQYGLDEGRRRLPGFLTKMPIAARQQQGKRGWNEGEEDERRPYADRTFQQPPHARSSTFAATATGVLSRGSSSRSGDSSTKKGRDYRQSMPSIRSYGYRSNNYNDDYDPDDGGRAKLWSADWRRVR